MIWATVDRERRWAYLPRPSSTPSIEIHLSSKSSSTFKIQYGGQFSHEEILSDRAPMLVTNDVGTFSRRMALVIGWTGNHAREFRISSLKLIKLIQKRKANESLSSRFLFPCVRPCLPCLPNCPKLSFRWSLVTSSGEVASQVSVYPLTRWGLPNKPNHLQLTPHQFIFDNYFPSLYWIWLRFKTKSEGSCRYRLSIST